MFSLCEMTIIFLCLSRELGRLGIATAALSEVRRPKSGEISVGGYTYYWSGRLDGYHSRGRLLVIAILDRLTQMVMEAPDETLLVLFRWSQFMLRLG